MPSRGTIRGEGFFTCIPFHHMVLLPSDLRIANTFLKRHRMNNINYQFVISLIIISLGYFSKKTGLLSVKDGDAITRLIFNFTLPAIVISTFSKMRYDNSLLLFPIICISFGLITTLLALVVFRKEQVKTRGMLSMLLPGFNIGLFAYPIVESALGQQGLQYIAMFDMGNAIIVFILTYIIAGSFSQPDTKNNTKNIYKRILTSIPLLTYVLTLILNITGISYPSLVVDISEVLAKANKPLALFVLGLFLNFSFESHYWKNIAKVLFLRYAAGALVGFALYYFLPFNEVFRLCLLIGLLLPVAFTVIPYSVEFNYDRYFVGTFSNINNIMSFIIIWLVLTFM